MSKVCSTETSETTQERIKNIRLNIKTKKMLEKPNKGEEIFMQRK